MNFVDIRKVPDLPPKGKEEEYSYTPYEPGSLPVGPELMAHFFHHPDHASTQQFVCQRSPKKRRTKLETLSTTGWGISLEESMHIERTIWLLFMLFFLGSLAFGICWAVLEHDISGSFGVASYVVTAGGIAAALLQTLIF